jgi:hypothetical protein
MKIVQIEWDDAAYYEGGMLRSDVEKQAQLSPTKTVGVLLYQDPFRVVVARDLVENEVRGVHVIPTCWITKMTTLHRE